MTSVGTVVSYPIPAYSNLPIEPQFFQPRRFVISAITLGQTTIVTTTTDHNYVIGQLIRLLVPASFGSYQLNESQGYVLSIPSTTQVEVSINSANNVNQFVASTATTVAQILAIGDIGNGYQSANGINIPLVTIPGSFINISPQ